MFQDADARQKKQEALESQELVHDSTVHISAEEQQVPNPLFVLHVMEENKRVCKIGSFSAQKPVSIKERNPCL